MFNLVVNWFIIKYVYIHINLTRQSEVVDVCRSFFYFEAKAGSSRHPRVCDIRHSMEWEKPLRWLNFGRTTQR